MSKKLLGKSIFNQTKSYFHTTQNYLSTLSDINKYQKSFNYIKTISIQNKNYSVNPKSEDLQQSTEKTILYKNIFNNLNNNNCKATLSSSIFKSKFNFSEKVNNNKENKENNNDNKEAKKKVNFIFVYANGKKEVHVEAEVGKNVLEIAHKFEVDLEGACDASLACSTCHVILEPKTFDKLPAAKEEEEDLLDLAFGLKHTSRLGCQVIITEEFEGAMITIPSATRNLYVDGHKPKPH